MTRKIVSLVVAPVMFLMVTTMATAQESAELNEHLASLAPYIGSWIGDFQGREEVKGMQDEVTFEVILNGHAVRSRHTATGGYGGETIFYYSSARQTIMFWYFTSEGWYSEGPVRIEGDTMHSEATTNGSDEPSWRAQSVMQKDGSYITSADYFVEGKWVKGHQVVYKKVE